MALKKTKKQSEQSATSTTSSTFDSRGNRRNYYIVYRDGLRIENLTFNESWDMFTDVLGSDNPCSVFREHEEMRVDH